MQPSTDSSPNHYRHFTAAVYCTVYDVVQMRDLDWLRERFDAISRHVKVGKVYLETHRDTIIADEATYRQAQDFFKSRGVQVSGGITLTVNERNHFQTFCYTNPDHRKKLEEIVRYTARLNDELILDDFFFTNCKCPSCIQAKGERSWSRFRLDLMAQVARELVVEPARDENPRVNVIIKYPNWYEHFQGLGFNLEDQPPMFDQVYTGTETRDPVMSNQHLQQYHGYSIFRYFENIKPGHNAGGWVDTGGMTSLDRYAEQLWITLFAKAPEVTLFNFSSLQRQITMADRAPWQGQGVPAGGGAIDFDALVAPYRSTGWIVTFAPPATAALVAGEAFAQVERFFDQLGDPLGVKCYRPYHATGEDFLHSYLGMVGIPVDIVPDFPQDAPIVLLTESAKADAEIVAKIERQLRAGKKVVITTGLLRAIQDRGMRDIVELEVTGRKVTVQQFLMDWNRVSTADQPLLVPQVAYLTNDSWEEISCLGGVTGYPLLHSAQYGGGTLYVLTIPDNFSDLYHLPEEVLSRIRRVVAGDLPVRLECKSQVALFAYDNDTCIVESFLPQVEAVRLVTARKGCALQDVLTGAVMQAEDRRIPRSQDTEKVFSLTLNPHAYRVFRLIPEAQVV
jgi:hypothetical protein